jgi:hypothetical protein
VPLEPGLIEFLVPDERAFGGADGLGGDGDVFVGFDDDRWADPDDDEPSSRWLPALAGIAVVGLLVSGVLAAAPWSADSSASPPPTSVPSTSLSAPTTIVAPAPLTTATVAPLDPARTGWLLDPVPADLTPAFFARGDDRDNSVDALGDASAWGEVWAEPGATRTSGRWFSVTLEPFASWDPATPEWFRVDVAGRAGHATVEPDGVVALSYDAGPTDATLPAVLVTIDAFGLGLDAMIELADSSGIVDDRWDVTRPELLEGFEQVAAGRTDVELTARAILGGPPRTSAFYAGPDRYDVTIVQEQPADLDDPRLLALATTVIPLADGWGPQAGFDGDGLTLGRRTIDGFDIVVARWREEDRTVSVLTTGDLVDLLAVIPDVRLASAEEWAAAERQAQNVAIPRTTEPRTPPGITVGTGTVSDVTTAWSVQHWASNDDWMVRVGDETYEGALRHPTMAVVPVTIGDVTLLIARSSEPGTSLVVTDAAGNTATVELVATESAAGSSSVDVDRETWAGVAAVESAAAFSAEVVAADGTVLHRFAPWDPEVTVTVTR